MTGTDTGDRHKTGCSQPHANLLSILATHSMNLQRGQLSTDMKASRRGPLSAIVEPIAHLQRNTKVILYAFYAAEEAILRRTADMNSHHVNDVDLRRRVGLVCIQEYRCPTVATLPNRLLKYDGASTRGWLD
jgi:hypothetical protein